MKLIENADSGYTVEFSSENSLYVKKEDVFLGRIVLKNHENLKSLYVSYFDMTGKFLGNSFEKKDVKVLRGKNLIKWFLYFNKDWKEVH